MIEAIEDFWAELPGVHKLIVVLIGLILAATFLYVTVQWLSVEREVRIERNKALKAEAEKNDALQAAAKTAAEIRKREAALRETEEKLNEAISNLDAATRRRIDAERILDGIRANPRTDATAADELCRILESVGHPCTGP